MAIDYLPPMDTGKRWYKAPGSIIRNLRDRHPVAAHVSLDTFALPTQGYGKGAKAAANEVRRHGEESVAPLLAVFGTHNRPDLVIDLLGDLGTCSVPALVELMENGWGDATRTLASMGDEGWGEHRPLLLQACQRILTTAGPREVNAVRDVGHMVTDPLFRDLLGAHDDARSAAVEQLARYGGVWLVRNLQSRMKKDPTNRSCYLAVLQAVSESAVRTLAPDLRFSLSYTNQGIPVFYHGDVTRALAAASLLGDVGPEALPVLVGYLKEFRPFWSVTIACMDSLAHITEEHGCAPNERERRIDAVSRARGNSREVSQARARTVERLRARVSPP